MAGDEIEGGKVRLLSSGFDTWQKFGRVLWQAGFEKELGGAKSVLWILTAEVRDAGLDCFEEVGFRSRRTREDFGEGLDGFLVRGDRGSGSKPEEVAGREERLLGVRCGSLKFELSRWVDGDGCAELLNEELIDLAR